jgi:type III pantothenate kinase
LQSDVDGVVVASVVPAQTARSARCPQHVRLRAGGGRAGDPDRHLHPVRQPEDVGADRIANAAAAHDRFGGPTVVVDFGTATTFDVVSANAEYLGGVIVPGLKVSADALFGATARLPRVEIVPPRSIIARTTVESVQAGLVYGTASMVDGVVERIAKEIGAPTVVATGGLAPLVADHCASIQHHEPWLTLEGLRLIFERNAGRDD